MKRLAEIAALVGACAVYAFCQLVSMAASETLMDGQPSGIFTALPAGALLVGACAQVLGLCAVTGAARLRRGKGLAGNCAHLLAYAFVAASMAAMRLGCRIRASAPEENVYPSALVANEWAAFAGGAAACAAAVFCLCFAGRWNKGKAAENRRARRFAKRG